MNLLTGKLVKLGQRVILTELTAAGELRQCLISFTDFSLPLMTSYKFLFQPQKTRPDVRSETTTKMQW